MKHDKLPAEIAQRIPQAAFDALQDNEAAQQSLIDMAQQALEAVEMERKAREEAEHEAERLRVFEKDAMRRRRGITVPLANIGTSRSLFDIQKTDEWRDVEIALDDSMRAGLISLEEYELQLRE